jgi:hypothetical protein
MKSSQMVPSIKDNSKMESNVEKESFSGAMEKYMKDNGPMAKNMEVEFGKVPKDKAILENGIMEKLKDSVFTSQSLETGMKESSKILRSRVSGQKDTTTVKHMLANTEKIVQMVKGNTFGLMETTTKDNS